MEYRILVVEDDPEIRDGIGIYLKNQGYAVIKAENGKEGLELLEREAPIHLVIADVMMPVMDGVTMVMKLRERYDLPVIILSAKSEDIDKITGLNIGADDYVTKPFVPMELVARVNAQLRRYARYLERSGGKEGERLRLTPLELGILSLLMKNPGRVFSASEIYERVWNEKAVTTDTIMVHVRNIREKIEIDPKNPKYLKVVWGIGYKIEGA